MIASLYYYLLVALLVTTTVFGLLFLTRPNDNKETLRNYRISKRLMAIAYFFVAVGNLLELFGHAGNPADTSGNELIITQILTLSVSVIQAFIITLVCVMLLDPKNIKSKKLAYQITAIVLYILIAVVSYIFLPKQALEIAIYLLTVIYCIILIYFTTLFVNHFRAFRRAMDNFYSDDILARVRWIAVAFYGSLGIGILALVTTYFSNLEFTFIFGICLLCFYSFFGIKLLNYPWQFKIIETPLVEVTNNEVTLSIPISQTENISYDKIPCISGNICIGQWIEEKHFLKPGITIDDLAKFLGTNRTYLSTYFNNEKGVTFRQWINGLRIEEAKHIISDEPKITMIELASRLGYADTSTFFRQFKTVEGIQPSVWKQQHLPS